MYSTFTSLHPLHSKWIVFRQENPLQLRPKASQFRIIESCRSPQTFPRKIPDFFGDPNMVSLACFMEIYIAHVFTILNPLLSELCDEVPNMSFHIQCRLIENDNGRHPAATKEKGGCVGKKTVGGTAVHLPKNMIWEQSKNSRIQQIMPHNCITERPSQNVKALLSVSTEGRAHTNGTHSHHFVTATGGEFWIWILHTYVLDTMHRTHISEKSSLTSLVSMWSSLATSHEKCS